VIKVVLEIVLMPVKDVEQLVVVIVAADVKKGVLAVIRLALVVAIKDVKIVAKTPVLENVRADAKDAKVAQEAVPVDVVIVEIVVAEDVIVDALILALEVVREVVKNQQQVIIKLKKGEYKK
jgi:hypothetical protein